jgi:hypothetical protein
MRNLAANWVAPAKDCLVNGKLAVRGGVSCKFSMRGRAGVKVQPDPGYKDVDEFGGWCCRLLHVCGVDEG